MVFSINIHKNGIDINPSKSESLGRIGAGPERKYLVIPNELVTRLHDKVINGKA